MQSGAVSTEGPAFDAVFEPVQPPTTFEETVGRLGTAIRLGLLPPGSQLPPERELAGRLRISRSTLRHALTTLVQSGHLVALRGRTGGTFVADEPPLAESGIESGAVVLAVERAGDEDLARLENCVARMAQGPPWEEYRRADVRFHIGVS